jgi:ADP-ribose pyrophosphatase YjhB (NUDIX family)
MPNNQENVRELLPKIGISGILVHEGKFLLGRRLTNDTQGGMWVTPGGGVEFGERLDIALIREFKEETRLEVTVKQGWASIQQRIGERHVVIPFMEVECEDLSPLIAGDGFDKVAFFTYKEVLEMKQAKTVTAMTFGAIVNWNNTRTPTTPKEPQVGKGLQGKYDAVLLMLHEEETINSNLFVALKRIFYSNLPIPDKHIADCQCAICIAGHALALDENAGQASVKQPVIGEDKCNHHWIGDTCSTCGVAWNVYVKDSIKLLERELASNQKELDEARKALKAIAEIEHNPKITNMEIYTRVSSFAKSAMNPTTKTE